MRIGWRNELAAVLKELLRQGGISIDRSIKDYHDIVNTWIMFLKNKYEIYMCIFSFSIVIPSHYLHLFPSIHFCFTFSRTS